jgi:hypothetical protein
VTDPTELLVDQLEAERIRGSRDETPANPLRDLIAALDRMLRSPGPPDFPTPTTDKITEEPASHE